MVQVLDGIADEVAGELDLSNLTADVVELQRKRPSDEVFFSSPVSTMARQYVGASLGSAVASGTCVAARARVTQSTTYTKVRFCTGTTAPAGLTDFRVAVWSTADGTLLATSANASATVNAATVLYEISLQSPLALTAGQDVYLGIAAVGTTPGTYRGLASANPINSLEPIITRSRTGWTGGDPLTLNSSYSGILWAELVA